jgi:hypothetical protein
MGCRTIAAGERLPNGYVPASPLETGKLFRASRQEGYKFP